MLNIAKWTIFIRAMHVVQSVFCPSVRPSVTLVIRGHKGWISSKVITRIISLATSLIV